MRELSAQSRHMKRSAEIRGFAKTFIGVRGSWSQVTFDEDAVFKGMSLKEELDRTATSAAVSVRHELTPLTSMTFGAGRSEQRFRFATIARLDLRRLFRGAHFDPAALLKGSARFGYTDLQAGSGGSARIQWRHLRRSTCRTRSSDRREFSGTITRNVESRTTSSQPYYLLTGGSVSIAQQIFGPVDVVGRAGAQRLDYESGSGPLSRRRIEPTAFGVHGVGVGFRLGKELRLGFNIDKERRTSVLPDREYSGLKYGMSLTYGL